MNTAKEKIISRLKRRKRVRTKVSGTAKKPRLNVFRSNKGMYVQLIDDVAGQTIVSASSKELKKESVKDMTVKVGSAFSLGKLIAAKALKEKITEAVFDRGGYQYHGRVKALADGAREGGLKI